MSTTLKYLAGLCIVAVFGAAGVWGTSWVLSAMSDESGDERSGPRSTPVGVATPEMRQVEDAVTAVGTLMPIRAVDIVPNAPGRVTGVPVTSGQTVEDGDLLVQLDDRAARAALAEAEATYSEARQDFQRIEELAESNTAAEARLEWSAAIVARLVAAVP